MNSLTANVINCFCVKPNLSRKRQEHLFIGCTVMLPTAGVLPAKSRKIFLWPKGSSQHLTCSRLFFCIMCDLSWKNSWKSFIRFSVILLTYMNPPPPFPKHKKSCNTPKSPTLAFVPGPICPDNFMKKIPFIHLSVILQRGTNCPRKKIYKKFCI